METQLAPVPATTPCRPRGVVVTEELPELLAAFTAREELRRAGSTPATLVAAADRLARAREAMRAGC